MPSKAEKKRRKKFAIKKVRLEKESIIVWVKELHTTKKLKKIQLFCEDI